MALNAKVRTKVQLAGVGKSDNLIPSPALLGHSCVSEYY